MKNLSVKIKLGAIFITALLLMTTTVMIAVYRVVTTKSEEAATVKAKSDLATGYEIIDKEYPGPWRIEGDKLFKGDTLMNGNYYIVDKIGDLTGDTATIFCNNTRVATNVIKDGQRAVGTTAAENVSETVLINGNPYYGEANVVGYWYQTAYTPIRDDTGKIIGMWYVGAPKSFVNDIINSTLTHVGIISSISLVVIIIFFWWFMTRHITNRLNYLVELSTNIANGDLTQNIKINSSDEIGRLAGALGKMVNNWKAIIEEVIDISGKLASHSEDLASSAQEVNASIEEIAGTAAEVASMAEKGLHNATATTAESENVVKVAQSSGKTIQHAVDKINSISVSTTKVNNSIQHLGELSAKIGSIIDVITGIANQTNLLSLNAAIEAARAGDQGRGFAVVAEEVRMLAEKSAGATREIGQLITRIQSAVDEAVQSMKQGSVDVNEGVQLASEAGAALENITQAMNKNIDLVREITRGAEQTSEGTHQLSANNEQIIATIQQVAASTQELSSMANKLTASVRKFSV
ncbi:MAG: methyl-accepting chemotaxis protein [Bacillota bacterium]